MKQMGCRKLLLSGFVLSTMAGLGSDRVVAQTAPSAPAVSLLRNSNLAQTVWPGDFNHDGITDLAASAPRIWSDPPAAIVVAIGNGDGTFQPPANTGYTGEVVGATDLDGDAKTDLLIVEDVD